MRGRSSLLIEARNARLFERYYYWTEVKRLRYDDALQKLSKEEFFLSEARVLNIVRECIREGRTVDGKTIPRPLFSGFRLSSPIKQKRQVSDKELSLFP